MAADDMTSQDAAVIGDDLVEALGFEPITADASGGVDHGIEEREGATSEVAVLDDVMPAEVAEDRSEIDHTTGDDIEIIEDTPTEAESFDSDVETDADEIAAREDTATDTVVEEADVDEEAEVDEIVSDDVELDDSVEDSAVDDSTDLESIATEAVDEAAANEPSGEVAETSLFGAPAPAYSWGRQSTKPDEDTASEDSAIEDTADEDTAVEDSAVEDSAVDDSAIDDSTVEDSTAEVEDSPDEEVEDVSDHARVDLVDEADESAEPVVFFSNGVDTDTEPISSLQADVDDVDEADLADDLASETDDEFLVSEVDAEDLDLETPEIDLSDPPPPTSSVNLIDLDRGDDLAVGDRVDDVQDAETTRRPSIDRVETAAPPITETALDTAESRVEPATAAPVGRKKLRARKSRRVVRHIDPWSVLTFSVLFHLCFFAALLLASVLVWNAALAAGTIENIENFVRELGDYETFEINSDQVFRAAVLIAGLLTLASSVLVVLLTVVFNLISDLIGGIRVTVIEEETVRIPRRTKK